MSDRESFLERWSRRKHQAEEPAKAPPQSPAARAGGTGSANAEPAPGATVGWIDAAARAPQPDSAPFDVASLPSIESITAGSDVRAFLAPGVPPELTRAALRRLWTADPVIRDYIGPSENAWDFNAPDGVPGFDDLPADFDVTRMVDHLFGQSGAPSEATADPDGGAPARTDPQHAQIACESSRSSELNDIQEQAVDHRATPTASQAGSPAAHSSDHLALRNSDVAMQDSCSGQPNPPSKSRRRHGGALPNV